MTKTRDPFADMKLTETVPALAPGRDQRLFAPSPPASPRQPQQATPPPATDPTPQHVATTEPSKLGTKEGRNLGTYQPRNLGVTGASDSGRPAVKDQAAGFDITIRAGHQANFLFTDEELDALDDLKRDAKRRHGVHTTKQDLVRFAVIELLNDYRANGAHSRAIRWLLRRAPQDSR